MKKKAQANSRFSSDIRFDQLYPLRIQALTKKHWTPLAVARKAADFLAFGKGARILDIGSGVGKFCLAAAHYKSEDFYFGIEQRISLVQAAEAARQILHLQNASFIHGNFTSIDFSQYDHFYFYNSFYENLVGAEMIDNNIIYSGDLYNYYNRHLYDQLAQKPAGTRLATYQSNEEEAVPSSYELVSTEINNDLKFWKKI